MSTDESDDDDGDGDDDEWDAKVRWFEPLDPEQDDVEPREGVQTIPVFPLGQAYLPYTSHKLVIFEPRYRAMYNDILFSGSRRFLVCNVDPTTGMFSEVGSVFYLDELKEISEQTQDRAKYVGEHTVIGRMKLLKVLNPKAADDRETYLRAEVEPLEDEDADVDSSQAEEEVANLFTGLINKQGQLNEMPRFTESVKNQSFSRGHGKDDTGLWGTIMLWQQFLEQRALVLNQKMQRDMRTGISKFLKDSDIDLSKVGPRGEMFVGDLPGPLAAEIRAIQRRYQEELEAMESDPSVFQALLQTGSHAERLNLFMKVLGKEDKRLTARATLQSLFKQ